MRRAGSATLAGVGGRGYLSASGSGSVLPKLEGAFVCEEGDFDDLRAKVVASDTVEFVGPIHQASRVRRGRVHVIVRELPFLPGPLGLVATGGPDFEGVGE